MRQVDSVSRNFKLCTMIGVPVFVFAFSALVVIGEAKTIAITSNMTITLYPNEYIAEWTGDIHTPPNESTVGGMTIKTTKQLPANLVIKSHIVLNKVLPFTVIKPFCEILDTECAEEIIKAAGGPEGSFPTACPFPAGTWSLNDVKTPTSDIPPATPSGHFIGTMLVYENIQQPYAILKFEGNLIQS